MLYSKSTKLERGSVLMEGAIVLPFFIMLIASVYDIGGMILCHQVLNDVAREGIRFAQSEPTAEVGVFDSSSNPCLTNQSPVCPVHASIQRRVRSLMTIATTQYGARFRDDAASSPWIIRSSYNSGGIGDSIRIEITARYRGLFVMYNNSAIQVSQTGPHVGSQNAGL